MTEHRIFRVYGRVQGVFFRQSAKQKADLLGLHGYARNEPDGSVTVEAEGPGAALDELALWCQHGPTTAEVERVEVQAGEMQGYDRFEVIH